MMHPSIVEFCLNANVRSFFFILGAENGKFVGLQGTTWLRKYAMILRQPQNRSRTCQHLLRLVNHLPCQPNMVKSKRDQ